MDIDMGSWIVLVKDEVHGSTNTLSEFMDLSDTIYKFMDLKVHFQSLWTCVFKVYMHLGDTKVQINGPTNAFLKFINLNDALL